MVERFENFMSAPVYYVTNTLFRKFRSSYDVRLELRWGGGAVGLVVYVYDIKVYIEKNG